MKVVYWDGRGCRPRLFLRPERPSFWPPKLGPSAIRRTARTLQREHGVFGSPTGACDEPFACLAHFFSIRLNSRAIRFTEAA